MDIVKTIDNYIAVADFVGDDGVKALLTELRQNLGKKKYLLPFFGQYSAGKSRLINHLLGRNLLPVKSCETTAFLTSISYGSIDTAVVQYADGHTETIDVEHVRTMDYAKVGDKIAAMYITLNNPFLQNGLTIVDTPGVNTIIDSHVEIAEQLLQNSLLMVYVLGKSPAKSDYDMIDKIEDFGITTIFVRTKIDEIHASEEKNKDIKTPIIEEKNDIEKQVGHAIEYFPVCNEECNSKNSSIDMFDILSDYISNDLSSNIANIYAASAEKRLKIIGDKLSAVLDKREAAIKESSQKSTEELINMQKQVELLKKTLENIISVNTKVQKDKIKSASETIADNLASIKNTSLATFGNEIESLVASGGNRDQVSKTYEDAVSRTCTEMGDMATKQIEKLSQETSESFANAIHSEIPSVEINLDLSNVEVINDEQDAILNDAMEKIARIQSLKEASDEEIKRLGLNSQQVEKIIAGYDDFINQANEEVRNFVKGHQPEYIPKESQGGKVMGVVGQVADIAMLFIPATGWAKVAKVAGNTANKISSTGRLATLAQKTLITIGKSAKAMSKADKALDVAKLLNQGQKLITKISDDKNSDTIPAKTDNQSDNLPAKTSNQSDNLPAKTEKKSGNQPAKKEKKDTNIFDYLSLSHWFGKIGEFFDPPTMEINQQLEDEFKEEVADMRRNIQQKVNEKIEHMRNLGLIKDELDANRRRKEMLEKEEQGLRAEIENLKKDLEKRRAKAYNDAIRKQCVEKFAKSTDEYATLVRKSAEQELAIVSDKIIIAANATVSQQLDESLSQLNEIISNREQKSMDCNAAIAEIAGFKNKLQFV